MAAETMREHQSIVNAIVKRDARGARAAMRQHMKKIHQRYIKEWSAEN
jgi:DNA-binding FadR family transcriptional regulator